MGIVSLGVVIIIIICWVGDEGKWAEARVVWWRCTMYVGIFLIANDNIFS